MNYKTATRKIRLELICMAPFVMLGRIYGRLCPLRTPASTFLFFSSADIGGAPQVNLDITSCIRDRKPIIIFSKKPRNNGFKIQFHELGVPILDLHRRIDNKLYHFVNFFYRGVLAEWINRSENPVVLGGENLFFYKVIPHLRKDIPRIEVCHLDTWLPYSIGLIDQISVRVCSTVHLREKIAAQYKQEGVERIFLGRLYFIENRIAIPEYEEVRNEQLEVVFIGRGQPQKRVHLVAAIARTAHEQGLPIHFSFVGDVSDVVDASDYPYCRFFGNIRDDLQMQRIYKDSDVLLLTSAYEGLPLVVMYMMAYGKVIVSTAVNAIPDYVRHGWNGSLIRAEDEKGIVVEGAGLLKELAEDPDGRALMGRHSRDLAIERFGGEKFCSEYRKLLGVKLQPEAI
jgi:glycosyltransferase involved in cell wall biosynthesis